MMNIKTGRAFVVTAIFFSWCVVSTYCKDASMCKLLTMTDQVLAEKYISKFLQKNKSMLYLKLHNSYEKDGQEWLRRYIYGIKGKCSIYSTNFSGSFSFNNIHPIAGKELCLQTDEGILILSIEGKLVGKISSPSCQTFMTRIHYIDLDMPNGSERLDEIVIKSANLKFRNKSTIRILKYIDNDYKVVFSRDFNESYINQDLVHPILEQIGITVKESDQLLLRINDEGIFEYFEFSQGRYVQHDEHD